MIAFKNRDIISIKDFSRQDVEYVLRIAKEMENNKAKYKGLLKGDVVTLVFFESSTRTRLSTYMAAQNLGATIQPFLYSDGTSAIKGETLSDTLMMLKRYGATVVAIRHPLEGSAQWAADVLDVPVINCGDGAHEHPTQTLLDLYTINKEKGKLDGLCITFVGDLKYGRTVHSLVLAFTKFENVEFVFVSPKILKLPDYIKEMLDEKKIVYTETEKLEEGVDSDVLYMTRIQEERFGDKAEYEHVRKAYSLKPEHLLNPNIIVMHPLPRNKRAIEIDPAVDALPQAGYMRQAENGIYVRMALLGLTTGKLGDGAEYKPEINTESEFEFKEIKWKERERKKGGYLVWEMESGTAVDHLKPNTATKIKDLLGLPENVTCTIGVNLSSGKQSSKDLLKIWGYQLNKEQMQKVALFSPGATINLISEDVLRKTKVVLPKVLTGMVVCDKPHCVSNPKHFEFVSSKFFIEGDKFICHYCGRKKVNGVL